MNSRDPNYDQFHSTSALVSGCWDKVTLSKFAGDTTMVIYSIRRVGGCMGMRE